jgi:hypothetical protein
VIFFQADLQSFSDFFQRYLAKCLHKSNLYVPLQPAKEIAEIVLRNIKKGKQIIIKYNLQDLKKILPLHSANEVAGIVLKHLESVKNYFQIKFGKSKKVLTFAARSKGIAK